MCFFESAFELCIRAVYNVLVADENVELELKLLAVVKLFDKQFKVFGELLLD